MFFYERTGLYLHVIDDLIKILRIAKYILFLVAGDSLPTSNHFLFCFLKLSMTKSKSFKNGVHFSFATITRHSEYCLQTEQWLCFLSA